MLKHLLLVLSLYETQTHAEEAVEAAAGAKSSGGYEALDMVLDITRGVQSMRVTGDGVRLKQFDKVKIAGGRNTVEPYRPKAGAPFCAFTPARPSGKVFDQILQYNRNKKSKEAGGAAMPFYMELDSARGIGLHQGDVSSYSGGCIRVIAGAAKKVFDLFSRNNMARHKFTIIDNTPGRYGAECGCLKKLEKMKKRDGRIVIDKARQAEACAIAAQLGESNTQAQAEKPTNESKPVAPSKSVKPVRKPKAETVAPVQPAKPVKPPKRKKTLLDIFRKKPKAEPVFDDTTGGLY